MRPLSRLVATSCLASIVGLLPLAGCDGEGAKTADTQAPPDTADVTPEVEDVAADTSDAGLDTADVGPVDETSLGLDYGATEPGATPRFDLGSDDWMSVGWPSDRYRVDGHVKLTNMPRNVADLLDAYMTFGEQVLDGFGLNGAIYVELDANLDVATLPSPEASTRPDAIVQLVNVSAGPARGERLPLLFRFYGEGTDPFYRPRTLAMRPVYGFPLVEGDTYCALVTRAVKDASGRYLQQSPAFAAALTTEPWLAPLRAHLVESPLGAEDLATATCFTAQHATAELVRVARYIDDAVPPELDAVFEPGVYGELHGLYTAPNFQAGDKPYQEEGDIRFDGNGDPIPQEDEQLRFLLLTPTDHEMPEAGWPVVLYAHGTGGDYESCRSDTRELVLDGLAVLCIDQPLHGPRGPGRLLSEAELVLYSFNFVNPYAGRSAFRQAAIDTLWLSRMIEAGRFDLPASATKSGEALTLDPENILFFGHSHGGLSGTLALAVDPRIKAGVISGMSGVIIETILRRKDPADLSQLAAALLGIAPEDLDTFHPALNLMQMLVDATDPISYTRLWTNPPAGVLAKHVFVTEGTLDHASPSVGTDAAAAAGGVPQVRPLAKRSDAHELAGLDAVDLPVRDNVMTADGPRTLALRQWQGGSHFVAFNAADARAMWRRFLVSAATEESPELSTGEAVVTRQTPVSAADLCADARPIPTTAGFPIEVRGNTRLAGAEAPASACPGGTERDHQSPNVFYRFEPPTEGTYRIRIALQPAIDRDTPRFGPDLVTVLDGGCGCRARGGDAPVDVTLGAGEAVVIGVGGSTIADVGPFSLIIEQRCHVLECGERECGNFGCGNCGTCDSGEYCTDAGRCEPRLMGDSCAAPIEASTLPYSWSGDSRPYSNDAWYTPTACPGFPFQLGQGSDDVVFRYVPPASGKLVATLDGDYDTNLWASTSCEAPLDGCLGANRTGDRTARLVLDATAGVPIYLFADGASNTGNSAGHLTLAVEACAPRCEGRVCGDDGCGGSCGSCAVGESCLESAGSCPIPYDCPKVTRCERVDGDICESAIPVTSLPFSDSRDTSDFYPSYGFGGSWCPAQPDGSGTKDTAGFGASDAAYAFTAPKAGLYRFALDTGWPIVFDASLYLVTDCSDIETSCLGADERDRNDRVWAQLDEGESVFAIVDGWTNFSPQTGAYSIDIRECVASCQNKQCGSDGCIGSCGTCEAGLQCQSNRCLPPPGKVCENPRGVGQLPWKETLDSTSYGADRESGCDGAPPSAASPDVTYRFEAPEAGSYRFEVAASFPVQLYLDGKCLDARCLASGTGFDRDLQKGEAVLVTVDGIDQAGAASQGSYTLSVRKSCTPSCEDKNCGADGCGGVCGTCTLPAGECGADQVCFDPDALGGNTCASAREVGALPFTGQGDTGKGATNDYLLDEGQCGGLVAKGMGSNDEVWRFTAPGAGAYAVEVATAGWDAVVWVVEDCADMVGSCLAGSDAQATEQLALTLSAGQTVFIVVDGAENIQNDAGAYELSVIAR